MGKQTKIAVTVENINPETALKYLDKMPKNRILSQPAVDRLARAMATGKWITAANEPIRFDTEGSLTTRWHPED